MKNILALICALAIFITVESCKKDKFTFSGKVLELVSKNPIPDADIGYTEFQPGVYPFEGVQWPTIGSSGSDGIYTAESESEHGYFRPAKNKYWSPVSYFAPEQTDTLYLFRESILQISCEDDTTVVNTGLLQYGITRIYPGTSSYQWVGGGTDLVVSNSESIQTAFSADEFFYSLASDMENEVSITAYNAGGYDFIDTTFTITPSWGDTIYFTIKY